MLAVFNLTKDNTCKKITGKQLPKSFADRPSEPFCRETPPVLFSFPMHAPGKIGNPKQVTKRFQWSYYSCFIVLLVNEKSRELPGFLL